MSGEYTFNLNVTVAAPDMRKAEDIMLAKFKETLKTDKEKSGIIKYDTIEFSMGFE